MTKPIPPHHTEMPDHVIPEFLATEKFLQAQLKWAQEQYDEVIDDKEAAERLQKAAKVYCESIFSDPNVYVGDFMFL